MKKVEEVEKNLNNELEEKEEEKVQMPKRKRTTKKESGVDVEATPKKKRTSRTVKQKVENQMVPPKRRTVMEIKTISPLREYIAGKMLLGSFEEKLTKADKPFIDMTLMDMTGIVNCKIWDKELKTIEPSLIAELKEVGPKNPIVVAVLGYKDEFDGNIQLKITKIKILEEDSFLNFVPSTSLDPVDMYKFIVNYCKHIRSPYKDILCDFFNEYGKDFYNAPAAKFYHDNFRCGLMEHTFKMLKMVPYVNALFPTIDDEVLAFMIIMHDFEKIHGYYLIPKPELTLSEIMVGHSIMGATKLYNALMKYNVPDKIVYSLMNSVVAHHGKAEYGAVKAPMTIEAQALMYIDNMVSGLAGAEQRITEKEYVEGKIKEDLYYINYRDFESEV